MYKTIMVFLLPCSLLSLNTFSNMYEKDLFNEPSFCERIYSYCLDDCESRNSKSNFSTCISDCSYLFEECKEKVLDEKESINCNKLYKNCSSKCENEPFEKQEDKCSSKCEQAYDDCINEEAR